jgi:adenylylsulfate kinase-like enzyme
MADVVLCSLISRYRAEREAVRKPPESNALQSLQHTGAMTGISASFEAFW